VRSLVQIQLVSLLGFTQLPCSSTRILCSAAITRIDLITSAECIFFWYFSQAGNTVNSSENHKIYLLPSLRIHLFLLSSTQESMTQNELNLMVQIPDMFYVQKECCFRAMEQDAFPRSLRSKAFGNLTPAFVRLVVGLIVLWIGLAVGFLRCTAEIETLFLIYTILNHCSLPHFSLIQTGPHPCLLWPIRNNTFP
jgi:hypothetical protein